MKRLVFALTIFVALSSLVLSSANAAEKKMSGADLKALLKDGKTIKLGGPGEAKTDGGTIIKIEGVWVIKGNKFCRTLSGLDGGKETCETWVLVGDNKAHVMDGKKKVGVNQW